MHKQLLTKDETQVLELLSIAVDSHHPSAKELERATHLNNRSLSSLIQHLIIVHHVPIVAPRNGEAKGYFIASNHDEAETYVESLKQQSITMNIRCNAVLSANFKGWMDELNANFVMNSTEKVEN